MKKAGKKTMRGISMAKILILVFFPFSVSRASDNNLLEIKNSGNHPEKNSYQENQVIVQYKKDKLDLESAAGQKENEEIREKTKATRVETLDDFNVVLIESEKSTEELVEELKKDQNVEVVEPNFKKYPTALYANDTYFSDQWYLNNTGQEVNGTSGTVDADTDAPEAWETEPALENSNIVAVIDTGVRHDHLDLISNMWDGSATCKNENNELIAGGCPNHGWDHENNDNDPNDDDGHGTFVSGIVGARTNNGRGTSGLSYNNKTKIMALRFGFDTFTEIKAINFAKNNGAKIINASFTGLSYSQIEKNAIDSFGGMFIAAAGNGGEDYSGDNNDTIPSYPASYTSSNIIAVAATDQNDSLTSFSNYGAVSVDIAAPGENLVSAGIASTDSYVIANGTSGATPIVAGISAVIYQQNPSLTISELRNAILENGDTKAPLVGKTVTGKRVNFNKALGGTDEDSQDSRPVYRFYSPLNRAHFFTISASEKDEIIAKYTDDEWRYEGIAYYVPSSSEGNRPVYRFYSPLNRAHFFTISASEKDEIIAKYTDDEWRYEGVAFYALNN